MEPAPAPAVFVADRGATGRTLLLVEDPDAMFARAVGAGATPASEMADENGWRLGRIFNPFGHEWELAGRWVSGRQPDGRSAA